LLALDVALATSAAPAQQARFDLVIRGGTVVDGTGRAAFRADVGVRGDRIVLMGEAPRDVSAEEIDASELIVAPGFIDIHSHSDYLLLEDGAAQSKIRQGVTTEILGEGPSAGPFVERLPAKESLVRGENRSWRTLGEYFEIVEQAKTSVNVASYVGLDNVWQSVMGQSFDRPSEQQITAMQALIATAMDDGALGLSTMLAMPPGSLATTDDLVALASAAAEKGGIYSSHIRHEGEHVFEAVREAIAIGERARLPVDIIHLKIADEKYWGRMSELVAIIEEARKRGVEVHANVYPYTRGNNNLASIIPPWAHEGGDQEFLKRLADLEQRERMKRDIEQGIPGWYNHYTAIGGDWGRMLISGKCEFQGLTMDRVIALKNAGADPPRDPFDILFDLLIAEGGSIPTVYAHHTEEDMSLAMSQRWCSIGSDGSAYASDGPLRRGNPHPRNFGTFPRVLGVYVRERKLLTLEDAVRKMTSLNAEKVGIVDRGVIREGAFADIAIFNAGAIIDRSTYTDPFHYNEGVEYVIVNGQLTLEKDRHTGAMAGRVLRRQ
jgi:N-acyl-D-aspartate/D-glutamate deacylase